MNPPKSDKIVSFAKRVLTSEELLQGEREVMIKHSNEYYRLMVTKAGKLILNK